MGQTAKALGVGAEFQFEGQTWALRPLTYKLLAQYSVWLVEKARRAVRRSGRYQSSEDVDRLQNAITRDEAAGHYEPFGRIFIESQDSESGKQKCLALMLAGSEHDADEETVLRMLCDTSPGPSEGETKRQEIVRKMIEVNSDPKVARGMLMPIPVT